MKGAVGLLDRQQGGKQGTVQRHKSPSPYLLFWSLGAIKLNKKDVYRDWVTYDSGPCLADRHSHKPSAHIAPSAHH